jgi:hypothetical protein
MRTTWALLLGLVLALISGHGADASLAALSCGDNCMLPARSPMLTGGWNPSAHGLRAMPGWVYSLLYCDFCRRCGVLGCASRPLAPFEACTECHGKARRAKKRPPPRPQMRLADVVSSFA